MTRIVLRIDFDDLNYIGHGRITLLEQVAEHGSIAKAAKAMNMSYKRAWYLLDEFGKCFDEPLIVRQHGGRGGGSAQLTAFGQEVVERYRQMEALANRALAKEIAALERHLAKRRRRAPSKAA